MRSFVRDLQLLLFVENKRIERHALHEKDVSANCRSCADDGFTSKDSRVRINRHVIFDFRMPFSAFLNFAVLVFLKAAGAERDAVIQFYARSDFASLPDYNAGSVIDKKI